MKTIESRPTGSVAVASRTVVGRAAPSGSRTRLANMASAGDTDNSERRLRRWMIWRAE